jgi:hypothetical protein
LKPNIVFLSLLNNTCCGCTRAERGGGLVFFTRSFLPSNKQAKQAKRSQAFSLLF